tara:strand:+ start:340 stop:729 length:390 start_codon:yes stop_codon:yes gene_type:complete
MKFGINAQVIIALLGALYILMVCREKYRIEYAEGEPVTVEKVKKKKKKKRVTSAVMPKPGSPEYMSRNMQAIPAPDMVAVKAKKIDVIEEEEEDMIEEEGMSTGAIAGITAVSIVALIAIMIMMRRLRR